MRDEAKIKLRESLRGTVIERGEADYDEARALYNGMIDKRPLLIARCADVADVIAAVTFGRDNDLPIAIRGGGHNGPGLASVDDGLVIDLSAMKGVRVDPVTRQARVGAGCTQGDVDHATHAFGLAVPAGIISTTGIAGLTLSGGHGYLTRKYGLTIDNLVEADVVLANGSFVVASKDNNPDLFWALRGGGGNFGVVTSFVFQLHPVNMVFAGPIAWDQKQARTIMQRYRDFLPAAPEELGIFLGLKTVPSSPPFPEELWGKPICLLMCCYDGPEDAAKKALAPLLDALPAPWLNWMGTMPYPAVQSMFDGLYPKGMQWYWRGDFVKTLPDAAIDIHLEQAAQAPSELSLMHLYPIDGAVHRVGNGETAWNCRDATWSMVIAGIDPNPQKAGPLTRWTKAYWEAVHPFDLGGAYPNFMMDDEGDARLKATYGSNYAQLAAVKRKYDSANLFRVNQNIRPAA
ncbi:MULTISPECIES: FAD-binding oxidoreductase [unclassified Bradyrhizobium]|uniref:FAD-binding oxidoreductase n=1 Tax=unclassified Bradyrhizobium TaxID=2631580 RepID=UPI001BAB13DC|nr:MULTISPECIES: FAD-binding oxidoreductase [unclassified Bradyrhizobium]MBR1201296.1 FAD-binding oxidoreductase [Bradyrhizobium sp. AUGA SZCCT0124]MBR1310452.1 FAD-binding oxidoreductase [Bradyrhizobium sp. AUGA SZCCT0051]MBR1340595.1 FAD-binding oxidoreductase [Bradyrhizobium sp. AUGA SZCCT0105]MBR1355201.1 FAD-binding oxidoreductase [Bradyrhizobium sp. AUGA SZCCT0045]